MMILVIRFSVKNSGRELLLDTGTHLVIGLGIAGLAHIDPIVASNSTLATAVFIGAVVGQQAPDFDSLFRMKSNAAYIKNHRGKISHSFPAILAWTLLITGLLYLLFPSVPLVHLGSWVFVAVFLHVLVDCFNAYGTQAMYPLTDRWISWNIIHIFDPVVFGTHLIALVAWVTRVAEPETIFPILYGLLVIYYIGKTWQHVRLDHKVMISDASRQPGDKYYVIPTVKQQVWNVVKRKKDLSYQVGEWRKSRLYWIDTVHTISHPAVEASKKHPDVAAFLYFSSFTCAELKEQDWGYEVRWVDVRYRHRKQYPFVAVIHMDFDYNPLNSYIGWLSDERLEKRLKADSY